MDEAQKRALAIYLRDARDTPARLEGLARLWLHFALLQGHKPTDTVRKDSPAWAPVARAWTPAASRATCLPSTALSSMTGHVACRAAELFETSRRDRAASMSGAAVSLFDDHA